VYGAAYDDFDDDEENSFEMDDYEERIKAYRERDYENDDINGDFGDADDFEDGSDDVRDGDGDFGDYTD